MENLIQTKKPLPIGQSFFDRVIEDGFYYTVTIAGTGTTWMDDIRVNSRKGIKHLRLIDFLNKTNF